MCEKEQYAQPEQVRLIVDALLLPARKAAMGGNGEDIHSNADQCEEIPFVSAEWRVAPSLAKGVLFYIEQVGNNVQYRIRRQRFGDVPKGNVLWTSVLFHLLCGMITRQVKWKRLPQP